MLNRNITLIVHYILDNLIPPIFRDNKWLMRLFIKIAYGSYTDAVMEFKGKYPFMSEDEISNYYELTKDAPINKRESDLNTTCLNYILENIVGESVLDAACGRGALLKKIQINDPSKELCGADIVLNEHIDQKWKGRFVQSSICTLPFDDCGFDTVICTHALEHIRDYKKAIGELFRIAKKRLIIVVPKQREYQYTPDFHIHFFPYLYSFKAFIGIEDANYFELKGDFLCVVDRKED